MSELIYFDQIKEDSVFWENGKFNLSRFLPVCDLYFAHKPGDQVSLPKETLEEHLDLVCTYFLRLVQEHSLENVIDRLINACICETIPNRAEVGNYIKKAMMMVMVYHDFGKINHIFQQKRMDNRNSGMFVVDHNFKHFHSGLGAYLFAIHHYMDNPFEREDGRLTDYMITLLTYPILKHHASALLCPFDNINMGREADFFEKYLSLFSKPIDNKQFFNIFHSEYIKKCSGKLNELFNEQIGASGIKNLVRDGFPFYALIKLTSSLLTAADYLATNAYTGQLSADEDPDFGTLTPARIKEIFDFVSSSEWIDKRTNTRNYNAETYHSLPGFTATHPHEISGSNLNRLRQEMAAETICNIRRHSGNNLFYIEAPTGGGKTNISMLATLELLKANPELNKAFYVFPYTTLVTQTHQSIIKTLNLHPSEVVQLHSKAGFQVKEEESDGAYGNDRKNYIDNLFVNFPFTLLSHIKFFDILKTNEKENNYLLHRLANSVVVIDELQSYNPAHWDKLVYFIRNYAAFFNIRFILMSATLPKLDKLKVLGESVNDFVYLLPDANIDYFNNPNFKQRVRFNFDLFDRNDLSLDELADFLLKKSKEYAQQDGGKSKPSGSIYTIIEFIFKKTATQFYQIINELNGDFFDEIFVLSGTILEHRRKYIIRYLKNPENRKKRILLITTQVVEAGVDIDMDLGFKDRSLIDSDEQLAGRINRNVLKAGCELFLFNYNQETIIYGNDKRFKVMKTLSREEYRNILENKNFDHLYNHVLDGIYEWNNKPMAVGFDDYAGKIKRLEFGKINSEFKLIEQENISCFVPLSLPCLIGDEGFFSRIELDFLSQHAVNPKKGDKGDEIDGSEVFDVYIQLIRNKNPDLISRKIECKILQGIMSKFVFSLFASNRIKEQIIHFSDMAKSEYGYQYLQDWKKFYHEDTGMNDSDFNSNETQFI